MKICKSILSLLLVSTMLFSTFAVDFMTASAETEKPSSNIGEVDNEISIRGTNSLGKMLSDKFRKGKILKGPFG